MTATNIFQNANQQPQGPVRVNAGIVDPIDETFNAQNLKGDNEKAVRSFLETQAETLSERNAQLGADFRNEIPNMLDVARVVKQASNGDEFSSSDPRTPPSGGLGINMITAKDIQQPAGTGLDYFDLAENGQAINQGNVFYWWGGDTATDFYKTTKPSGSSDGYALYVIKDGIIQEGTAPIAEQFKADSDDRTKDPFIGNPVDTISVDSGRDLTRYSTDEAYFLNWQIGQNLRSVATRDANSVPFNLVGVVVYQEDYFNSLHTY